MYESLKSRLSGGLSALTPADDLLSILWTSTSRPEVLAVVGHLQTNDVTGEPVGERILLAPKGSWTSWPPPARAWLMPDPILEGLVYEPRWEAPSPLVMLMACESGSLEVSDLTGFVKSFMAAGAGAVIGTESTIYASLAGRFVREVTLWMTEDDMTLGEAVQRFYRGLLDDRIPMPFTFTAVGNADLTFKPGDSHDA